MLRFVFPLILVAAPATAETWLCNVQDGAGYRWNPTAQEFQPQTFTANDTYILRPFKPDDRDPELDWKNEPPQYVAVELGEDDVVAYFYSDLAEATGTESLVGRYAMSFYAASNELVVQSFFYPLFTAKDERTNQYTPYFAIGRCSKI